MNSAYYKKCEYCGNCLDPEERCDCAESKKDKEKHPVETVERNRE